MGQQSFYIRNRGKVTGPFTLQQLKSLRNRGQLGRFHELSEDRQTWAPASAYAQLFPGGTGIATDEVDVLEEVGSSNAPTLDWHYVDSSGNQQGPIDSANLAALLQRGAITESTLVWRAGLANWVEVGSPQAGIISSQNRAASPAGVSGQRTSWFAVAALVVSILWIGGIGSVLGIVFGLVALEHIKDSQGRLGGRSLAISALVIGSVLLVFTPVAVLFYLALAHSGLIGVWGSATPQEVTEIYRNRVYAIKTDNAAGSGILLANDASRGLIATNLHVLVPDLESKPDLKLTADQIPKLTVQAKNVTQLNFRATRLAAFHRRRDLAFLVIEIQGDSPAAVAVLSQKKLKQGEPAVTLGNPHGLEFFTSSGIISSTSGELGYIWTTCPVSSGNSGGPLVLSRGALLVGINTIGSKDETGISQNLNGSIPAEEIVLSLRSQQADAWVWANDLKPIVLRLGDMVRLEE
jgi:S1-C subfamily serine protease